MKQIILFLKRQKDFFVFLILLMISFVFIFDANSYQKSRYLHSANIISGNFYQISDNIESYFNLKSQNLALVEENKKLHQQLLDIQRKKIDSISNDIKMTFSPNQYNVFRAEVIKNSISLSKNYILINKGQKDSICQDMGVVSPKGVVGIIDKVSGSYASVQSVLNTHSRLNVALKNTGHYGTLNWQERKLNIVQLVDIPDITPVKIGDTIVTDGRSSIFPKGIPVGIVKELKKNSIDNSWVLDVQLFTDMSNVQHVYIIQNKNQAQLRELETEVEKLIENE